MKILVVGKTTSSNFNRLKQEGEKRNHQLINCSSKDLIIHSSNKKFHPTISNKSLKNFDLIYLLAVGKRKWPWYLTCHYLHQTHHTTIIEQKYIDPSYNLFFTPIHELLKQKQNDINFPYTTTILSPDQADAALKNHRFPLIIKTGGQRGQGVYKVESKEQAINIINQNKKSKSFMFREFIPNNGDIRVFTVGYQAIGVMHRIPPNDSFKSNISQGGTAKPFPLQDNPKIKQLAEKTSRLLHTEIAGIDIMLHQQTNKPYVLEVNRGPQFTGLEKYTQHNIALSIIKHFEKRHNQ